MNITVTPDQLPAVDIFFGILSMVCFFIGTPASLFCLLFFAQKPKKTINIHMFILISATDLITCVLILFVGLSAFNIHFFFDNPVFCNLWGVLWSIVIKLSIVMIAVLSITRTISILQPLTKISINVVLSIVGLNLLVFVVHSTTPYWFGVTYSYYVSTSRCTWDDIEVYGWGVGKAVEFVITPIFTFLLPTLTVVACFCVLMSKLLFRAHKQVLQKKDKAQKKKSEKGGPRASVISIASTISTKGDAKVHSTITVLMLTVLYIALTVPCTVMRVIGYTHELLHEEPYEMTVSYDIYRLVTTYFLPMNAVCNTILYYVRIRDLRRFTCAFLRKLRCFITQKRTSVTMATGTVRVIANSFAVNSNKLAVLSYSRSPTKRLRDSNNAIYMVEFCENCTDIELNKCHT